MSKPDTIEKLTSEQRKDILNGFRGSADWKTDIDRIRTTSTSGSFEDERFKIIAREYQNIGGSALKVVFFEFVPNGETDRERCIGIAGYHNEDAQPYERITIPRLEPVHLYTVLESAS